MLAPSVLAVIPARGGSTRIPKKNIVPIGGKPLIAWTIEVALLSGVFSDVLVSTDDDEIAEVAKQYGATVPFLRKNFADEHSPVAWAVCEAVQQYEEHGYPKVEAVALLQPNSPLLKAEDIVNAYENFISSGVDAQGCCAEPIGSHIWWAHSLNEKQQPKYFFEDKRMCRSQDLPKVFLPSGAICFAKRDALLREKNFGMDDHIAYPIPWISAFDIDTQDDLMIAEALIKSLR